MEAKNKKAAIRLNVKEVKKAAIDHNLETNQQIADAIGVTTAMLWKATKPIDDPNYSEPGKDFIAGVLKAFGEPFERFFFLEDIDTNA